MGSDERADAHKSKLTKNQKRRSKKKESKSLTTNDRTTNGNTDTEDHIVVKSPLDDSDIEIEYVSASVVDANDDPMLAEFKHIFEKFATAEELTSTVSATADISDGKEIKPLDGPVVAEDNTETAVDEPKKLSKKKKKLMSRLSVAELKQLVPRPDVVEAHDITASDPRLLVFLKAYRNTVPIPRHWCHKRKYLQGKRGIEKSPFELPEFIAETGIAKIRESVMEQEALKKSKQKARDRLAPKMGKIDIDYQVLHDAFFKYQKKPKLSQHGDLYFEGKEFEVDLKEKKPGQLSPELVAALGMTDTAPPPWLINMQRYGPPPSYPNLKIAGLNSPLPPGASFGYHPGGWGKPPVDEYGRPLYGNVFGAFTSEDDYQEEVDKSHWGELVEGESEEEEEEEVEEEEEAVKRDYRGAETPMTMEGMSSVTSGLETPDTVIDLRKRAGLDTPDSSAGQPKELFHVLQERNVTGEKGQLFGSDRTYVLPGKSDVNVSINPDQLEDELEDMGQQDRLKDAYEAEQGAGDGEFQEDRDDPRGKRKRRADANTITKRNKGFKF
mmetsp:Transcript_17740/g.17825  ORF Transcript_17740/g.17825 Transcript_17740/m.17825 type:complete len:554 (+) Transcript_17740:142-1803(+)|eukprot:CAMPEP_0182417736 /NCGR_PEP_ID=MMETSP1167-20130531/2175_1 /TAXON_ID=2988 /ORGANISM="Mallomonas Sp, Strain CCMP3275" /LENGTH=553 /DNA_ID=CAMNT_0024591479 /DNA_START=114 /DNA_END=1775 /DNA_ORIENTATION=+